MKKLLCRDCGNAEFYMINVNEALCKCGLRLTKLSDYRWEKPKAWNEHVAQKRQAENISNIILLRRQIDKCLDERDEEGFKKLTEELKACHESMKKHKIAPASNEKKFQV